MLAFYTCNGCLIKYDAQLLTLTIATAFFSINASSLKISFFRLKQLSSVEANM